MAMKARRPQTDILITVLSGPTALVRKGDFSSKWNYLPEHLDLRSYGLFPAWAQSREGYGDLRFRPEDF